MIDAVIFDMDGLLLDTERVYFQTFRTAHDTLGLPQNDDLFMSIIGLDRPSSQAVLRGIFADAHPEFEAAWHAHAIDALSGAIPVKPGVRDLTTALAAANIPYAIATSTKTDHAHENLARAGIADLFDTLIGGDQVQNGKPAPDIYLRAAETLGIAPARCAAFEDSENGVRAALAAGMITTQVPDLKHPDADFRALGHAIAPDLMSGAQALGLLS